MTAGQGACGHDADTIVSNTPRGGGINEAWTWRRTSPYLRSSMRYR
jgi:hypothetical protein